MNGSSRLPTGFTMSIWLKSTRQDQEMVAMGRHAFSRLRERLSPEARAEAAALTEQMERALSLAELRKARSLTQDQLAADPHVGQASIAKLERRTDM